MRGRSDEAAKRIRLMGGKPENSDKALAHQLLRLYQFK